LLGSAVFPPLSNHRQSYIDGCNLRQQQITAVQSLNSLHFCSYYKTVNMIVPQTSITVSSQSLWVSQQAHGLHRRMHCLKNITPNWESV